MVDFDEGYGRHHDKFDIERIGIFAEMQYMHGKGYVSPFAPDKKDPRTKGAQMLPGGPKIKTGLQDCYFDQEFHRLFIGEAWKNPVKKARAARIADLKKRTTDIDFIPSSYPKKRSGSGDYYGTFGGIVEEFSPIKRKERKREKEPPNFYTTPGKKGGPNYPDIYFTKYPEHLDETFGGDPVKLKALRQEARPLAGPFRGKCYPTYFDINPSRAYQEDESYYAKPEEKPVRVVGTGVWIPNSPAKKDGGCKAGALNEWPEHKSDRAKQKPKKEEETGIFYPQARNKTMYTTSVSQKQVDRCMNVTNWRTFKYKSFPNVS